MGLASILSEKQKEEIERELISLSIHLSEIFIAGVLLKIYLKSV